MLAIIIPYYKLTFFETTLQSLVNQADKRFKVYICDDASPEDPTEILANYEGQLDFVYHRFGENLGRTSLTQQWERCIALSENEEWIMILGDDDFLGDNIVEEFYTNLDEINHLEINIIKFSTQLVNCVTGQISKLYQNPKLEKAGSFYYRKFLEQTRSSLSEYIFKRTVYLKYGFKNYPLGWYADDYAWIEFSEQNYIYSINKGVMKIGVSEKSISGNNLNFHDKNRAELLFFKDLVKNKLQLFEKKERLELLYHTEVLVKRNRKLKLSEYYFLVVKYMINFSTIPFLKFIRRFLISIFR